MTDEVFGSEDWALSVGIGDYLADAKLKALPGARTDAEHFDHWVGSLDGGNVAAARRRLIQSPHPQSEAEPAPIDEAIEGWFEELHRRGTRNLKARRGFRIGRRLYLYFSGHGLTLGEGPSAETVLLMADAEPPAGRYNHFAGRVWADWFRNSGGFDEVVLIMDCCRTSVRTIRFNGPPWEDRYVRRPGRYFYAFAVNDGETADEIEVGGRAGGRFTHELLRVLEDRSKRPLTARKLGDLLYAALGGAHEPSIQMPPFGPEADFELLGAAAPLRAPWNEAVIAYEHEAASRIAGSIELAGGSAVPLRTLVTSARGELETLILESDTTSLEQVDEVVCALHPKRMVVYGGGDPIGHPSESVIHVQAQDTELPALALKRVRAAIDCDACVTVRITAEDALARVHVWSSEGELLAEGIQSVVLKGIPVGNYRFRATLGRASVTQDREVRSSAEVILPAIPLNTPFPLPGNRQWTEEARAWLAALDPNARVVVVYRGAADGSSEPGGQGWHRVPEQAWKVGSAGDRCTLQLPAGEHIMLSVPSRDGYRTEVYIDAAGRSIPDVSIRIVESDLPVGSPRGSDRTREALRLVLRWEGAGTRRPEPSSTEGDAIAALLALAADLDSRPVFLQQAAAILGAEDEDVAAWAGGSSISAPPLLASSWSWIARQDAVHEATLADAVTSQQVLLSPWFAWGAVGEQGWLQDLARAVWPRWSRSSGSTDHGIDQVRSIEDAARALEAPASSLRRCAYKIPPVDQLVGHDKIAFVGGSNDQLAAAIVIAFVERQQRRWADVTMWFLDDDYIDRLVPADRSNHRMRRVRDRAQAELECLLPKVAERWRLLRYSGFHIRGEWHFASLWDWDRPGGVVHLDSQQIRTDVRSSPRVDLQWSAGAAAPPGHYQEVMAGYLSLQPSRVIAAGGA